MKRTSVTNEGRVLLRLLSGSFARGFFNGINSASYVIPSRYHYVPRSDVASMREDWMRIGNDLRKVVAEHGKVARQSTG